MPVNLSRLIRCSSYEMKYQHGTCSYSYFESLVLFPVCRYGYHVSQTTYVVCHDPPTIQKIFWRIRNFDGEGLYPKMCGGIPVVHIRDVATGYDSSQPDLRSVRQEITSSPAGFIRRKKGISVCRDLSSVLFPFPSVRNLYRYFLWRRAVPWSPSRYRTALWPRSEPAAPNPKSNATRSTAPHLGTGKLRRWSSSHFF